ncbi:MAG: PD40 domain-containing protein [Verrucomicrobiales bacterium]|nr:PD40 domain-containing protein [Verrucomicrobiales bacterium]
MAELQRYDRANLGTTPAPSVQGPILGRIAFIACVGCGLVLTETMAGAELLSPAAIVSATAQGDSLQPVLSADGRKLLFLSGAPDLVPEDANGVGIDAFICDLETGGVELVTATPDGAGANGSILFATLSPDARHLLFLSSAPNFVPGDVNSAQDIFLRDLEAGETTLVSVNAVGTGTGNAPSSSPSMTADGRLVVFESVASDLVTNDTNGFSDVFLRDVTAGTTRRLSEPSEHPAVATKRSGPSWDPVLSPDGHWVAFTSDATNLATEGDLESITLFSHNLCLTEATSSAVFVAWFAYSSSSKLTPDAIASKAFSLDGSNLAFEAVRVGYYSTAVACEWSLGDVSAAPVSEGLTVGDHQRGFDPAAPLHAASSGDWFFEARPEGSDYWTMPHAVYQVGATHPPILVSTNQVMALDLAEPVPFGELLGASADGNRVAFLSALSPDSTYARDAQLTLYVRDLVSGETRLIPRDTEGAPLAVSDLGGVSFSEDGQLLAFATAEPRLVEGDLNHAQDVFVYDWNSDTLRLISARYSPELPAQTLGRSSLSDRCLSADGRYLVFASEAGNVVAGDANEATDVFLRDLETGAVSLVSVNHAGDGPGNGLSREPIISNDGEWIAFVSTASDLVAGDDNDQPDVFLQNRETGAITRASAGVGVWIEGPVECGGPALSFDGNWLAFEAVLLNAGEYDRVPQLILYQRVSGETTLIDQHYQPALPGRWNGGYHPRFAPDGSTLVFRQTRINDVVWALSPADRQLTRLTPEGIAELDNDGDGSLTFSANGRVAFGQRLSFSENPVLVHDLATGTQEQVGTWGAYPALSTDGRFLVWKARLGNSATGPWQILFRDLEVGEEELISIAWQEGDAPANAGCRHPHVTPDGRYVIFSSSASNLNSRANNGKTQVFARDRLQGKTLLLSLSGEGACADGIATEPVLSPDGNAVLFTSFATNVGAPAGLSLGDLYLVRIEDGLGGLPVLTIRRPGSGETVLTWAAEEGVGYAVEYRDDIETDAWHRLAAGILIEAGQATATDAAAPLTGRRFYRVVEEPSTG